MRRVWSDETRPFEEAARLENSSPRRRGMIIDLGQPAHRRNVVLVLALAGLVALVALYGAFKVFEYSESAPFCGATCHPMRPIYVRYASSAHARVACAQCHVGPGIAAFVNTKIAGARELVLLLTDTHRVPIASPVHTLRPARETCHTCHMPSSFADNIVKKVVHYADDEANTRIQTTLMLKMGGWQESNGSNQGIHWHTNSEVYYIAADEQRQVMLWVGVRQPDGRLKEFFARDILNMARTAFVEQARANGQVRLMDCIDCHNRTAHDIPSPADAVDQAISAGAIPTSLPSIRKRAVELLTTPYDNQAQAYAAIDDLENAYRADYADDSQPAASSRTPAAKVTSSDMQRALDELKRIYAAINFPEMRLTWETNPNNASHQSSPGCYRCHDGKHVSVDGAGNEAQVISVKCNLCHTVPITGRGEEMLVEAPVIVGAVPESHADFRWTTEHRSVTDTQKEECLNCHGRAFCSNKACHDVSHPPDMLYTHDKEFKKRGGQVCYTCHQNVLCSRCHAGQSIVSPKVQ